MTQKLLTKAELLAIPGRRVEWVPLPGVGDGAGVYVRSLSARERDQFEAGAIGQNGDGQKLNADNLRARLVVLAACDADAAPLFAPEDADAVGQMDAAFVDPIFEAAVRLGRLGRQEAAAVGKESAPTAGATSP